MLQAAIFVTTPPAEWMNSIPPLSFSTLCTNVNNLQNDSVGLHLHCVDTVCISVSSSYWDRVDFEIGTRCKYLCVVLILSDKLRFYLFTYSTRVCELVITFFHLCDDTDVIAYQLMVTSHGAWWLTFGLGICNLVKTQFQPSVIALLAWISAGWHLSESVLGGSTDMGLTGQ